jgi:hypothetical protein
LKSSPLRLAFLAVALTAGRAAADLGCVSDIRDAGPDGSFCHGHADHPSGQAQQPAINPAAATQLTNMAGGVMGSMLGNALVAPLPNQYQGRKPVKPAVTEDDGIKTPGTGAASDIIGGYQPRTDDSYASRLAHFRELHDAEMDQRRAALEKLKGTGAEKWCAAHIGILFPEPPKVDIVNSYPNKVRSYDREKQTWDKRCGGPSQQVGYAGFTDELAGLKPDAAPAPVAGTTTKAPTYEAPAPPPAAEPEKPAADSFADAEKELGGPPEKKTGAPTDAPSSAQSVPADQGSAPDSGPSPDDSKNTNHSTNFFGQPNAKVTEKDLADSRAPELDDLRPGTAAPPPAGGAPAPGSAPKMLSDKPLRVIPSGPPLGAYMPSEYGFEGRGGYDAKYDRIWGKETPVEKFIDRWNFVDALKPAQEKVRGFILDKAKEKVSAQSLLEDAKDKVTEWLKKIPGTKGLFSRAEDTADGRNLYETYSKGVMNRALDDINGAVDPAGDKEAALNGINREAAAQRDLSTEADRVWMEQVKDPMDLKGLTQDHVKELLSPLPKQASIREKKVCYWVDSTGGINCGPKIVYSPPR